MPNKPFNPIARENARSGLTAALGLLEMIPGKIVMRGSYLYDGSVSCELCIILSPVRYGTGDYEDEADIAEDAPIETYYVYFDSPASQARFNSGGGGYPSLADAMVAAERAPGIGTTVRWAQQSVAADRAKPRSG